MPHAPILTYAYQEKVSDSPALELLHVFSSLQAAQL